MSRHNRRRLLAHRRWLVLFPSLTLLATLSACGETGAADSQSAVAAATVRTTPIFFTPTAVAPPTPLPPPTPGSLDPSHLEPPDPDVRFTRQTLQIEDFEMDNPTTLAFGPDGRLYVGTQNGTIIALTLEGRSVAGLQVIADGDSLGDVLGITFDPNAPPDPVTLYVSHSAVYRGKEGPPYPGKVTKLVAPGYIPIDVITGLPVSAGDHATNGLLFDDEGRLYIAQGGTTNAGFPSEKHPRDESPLSGAILVADLQEPGFDGAVRYDPPDEVGDTVNQVSGDVRVFASGFRNPYDLLLHSNGKIYATDNGPNVPDGRRLVDCLAEEPDPWEPDELNVIVEGQYYGHPNPNRARFDPRQCTYGIPLDTSAGATPPIALLGYSTSVNGLVEYTADAFDGRMMGDLIYVEWMTNRIWRVVLTDDGEGVAAISRLIPGTFHQPLDVTVGRDGTIYVAEFGGDRISSLTPVPIGP